MKPTNPNDHDALERGLRARRRVLAARVEDLKEAVGLAVADAWPSSADDAPVDELEQAQRELTAAECALAALPLRRRVQALVRDAAALAGLDAEQQQALRRAVKAIAADLPGDASGLGAVEAAREAADAIWQDASEALPPGILARVRDEIERRLPVWTPDTAEETIR